MSMSLMNRPNLARPAAATPSGSLLGSGAVRPRAHKQLGVPHLNISRFTGIRVRGVVYLWYCTTYLKGR